MSEAFLKFSQDNTTIEIKLQSEGPLQKAESLAALGRHWLSLFDGSLREQTISGEQDIRPVITPEAKPEVKNSARPAEQNEVNVKEAPKTEPEGKSIAYRCPECDYTCQKMRGMNQHITHFHSNLEKRKTRSRGKLADYSLAQIDEMVSKDGVKYVAGKLGVTVRTIYSKLEEYRDEIGGERAAQAKRPNDAMFDPEEITRLHELGLTPWQIATRTSQLFNDVMACLKKKGLKPNMEGAHSRPVINMGTAKDNAGVFATKVA